MDPNVCTSSGGVKNVFLWPGLFVFAIGCDQFEAIFTDETLVEQAKRQGPYRPKKPKMALLAEVCGRGHHPITWLLPCQSYPRHIQPAAVNYAV